MINYVLLLVIAFLTIAYFIVLYNYERLMDKFILIDEINEILKLENPTEENILNYIDIIVSENARLEDIEDTKVQIEYELVFNKGVKSVQDKIKSIMEDLEEIDENFYDTKTLKLAFKNSLQELLKEE